jgi:hypothetical protein
MKDIKEIEIVFENCEAFTVPYKYVHTLIVDGFKNHILIQSNNGRCFDYHSSDYVYLQIEDSPEIVPDVNFTNPFKKRILQYNDITQITLVYIDDEKFNFCVPWGGDDDYTNEAQIVEVLENGRIAITISKNKETDSNKE